MCYALIKKPIPKSFFTSFLHHNSLNSYCEDYITEKFYRNLYAAEVVPIVFGGGDYARDAPPNSFINVDDFDSVQSLAKSVQHYEL